MKSDRKRRKNSSSESLSYKHKKDVKKDKDIIFNIDWLSNEIIFFQKKTITYFFL